MMYLFIPQQNMYIMESFIFLFLTALFFECMNKMVPNLL